MNAVAYLQAHGERTADQIAVAIGVEIEAAYLELVRAEGQGLVRVNVEDHTHRTWEAMSNVGRQLEARP